MNRCLSGIMLAAFLLAACNKMGSPKESLPTSSRTLTGYSVYTQKIIDSTTLIKTVVQDIYTALAPGVSQTEIRYTNAKDSPMHVFLLSINTSQPGVFIETGTALNKDSFSFQTIPQMVTATNAANHKIIAAVNGDFIDEGSTQSPFPTHGVLHKNGVIIKGTFTDTAQKPQQGLSFFGLTKDDTPMIDTRANYPSAQSSLYNVTGGGVVLIKDHVVQTQTIPTIDPRTGIGFDDNGVVYMIVIDGRNSQYATGSCGMNYADMAALFNALGAKSAVNLDGGGSSTFVSRDPGSGTIALRNLPSNPGNTPRQLNNCWMVYLCNFLVSNYAGTGVSGLSNGAAVSATFSSPEGCVADQNGNLYVADRNNNVIRKISSGGVVSTFAGTGVAGYADGPANTAQFSAPWRVAIDGSGNLIVADRDNFKIRKITPAGVVSTIAGSTQGFADGTGSAAKFSQPLDVALDPSGNIIVADNTNHRIRKVTPAGVVTTIAGNGTAGYLNGTGTAAEFNYPSGLAVDGSGDIYVADRLNQRIRKITSTGAVTSFAGTGVSGNLDGANSSAKFSDPYDVGIDGSGNLFVADLLNSSIREISGGQVTTPAGGKNTGYREGTSTIAWFNQPTGVACYNGDVYVADHANHRIRKIKIIQ